MPTLVVGSGVQIGFLEGAYKSALDEGNYHLAAQKLLAFSQKYRDSELVDEALFRHAQALSKGGKLQEAQAALQDFLEKRPTSPFKNAAAVELAALQSKLGQPGPPPPQLDRSVLRAARRFTRASEPAGRRDCRRRPPDPGAVLRKRPPRSFGRRRSAGR